jgi:hypothetical protein
MMLTVSAAGLAGTTFAPSTNTALLSFEETRIWAIAPTQSNGIMVSAKQSFAVSQQTLLMTPPLLGSIVAKRQSHRAASSSVNTNTNSEGLLPDP